MNAVCDFEAGLDAQEKIDKRIQDFADSFVPPSDGHDEAAKRIRPEDRRQAPVPSAFGRLVKRFVATKQLLGRWLVSTSLGFRVYAFTHELLNRRAGAGNQPHSAYKTDYRKLAESALAAFLEGKERLTFPKTDAPRVSVVLVLYNQAPLTLQCLLSIRDQANVSYELIVVDNGSSDDTGKLLATIDNVHVIHNAKNAGFIKAVNQAASLASGANLLLLNNDAILLPGAISNAERTLAQDSGVGSVGGRIILLNGALQEAGSVVWNDGSCEGYGRGGNPIDPEYMFRREVDFCSAVFLLTPREVFDSAAGFDEAFSPAYYEDVDYCVKLSKLGYRNIYEPLSTVLHYEFASSDGHLEAVDMQRRNRELFCKKHQDFLAGKLECQHDSIVDARSPDRSPRLLFVDDRVPHESLGAGYPRSSRLVRELTNLGFFITFYPLRSNDDSWQETYRTLPANVEVMLTGGMYRIREFLLQRPGFYDGIVVSRNENMEFVCEIMRRHWDRMKQVPLIYDCEAITTKRDILQHELEGRHLSVRKKKSMLEKECALAQFADAVIAVSDHEAELFRHYGCEQVFVVGHSIDVLMTTSGFGERDGYLFVGALRDNESPNVDSLLWFVNEVFPLIKAAHDNKAILYVAGDHAATALASIEDEQVIFLGRVEDLYPVYDRCRVFIAPTRFAAGIPHKVHEAAAYGVPCVGTSVLEQQLGWKNDEELLVADDAASFASNCVALHTNPMLWEGIRQRARKAVDVNCSTEQFRKSVGEAFNRFFQPDRISNCPGARRAWRVRTGRPVG